MEIYTIGFGGHSAPEFFRKLESAGIERLIDVRLNNVSQLAGFTKAGDLPFLLERISGIEYRHDLELAPKADMLRAYRSKDITWTEYERRFLDLMADRKIQTQYSASTFDRRSVLLCSEPTAKQCHRRLVLDYLRESAMPELESVHL